MYFMKIIFHTNRILKTLSLTFTFIVPKFLIIRETSLQRKTKFLHPSSFDKSTKRHSPLTYQFHSIKKISWKYESDKNNIYITNHLSQIFLQNQQLLLHHPRANCPSSNSNFVQFSLKKKKKNSTNFTFIVSSIEYPFRKESIHLFFPWKTKFQKGTRHRSSDGNSIRITRPGLTPFLRSIFPR